MNPFYSLIAASSLAFIYVGSLYVWRSDHDRDSPITIKRRFLSAFCTVCISPFVVKYFVSEELLQKQSLYEIIGIRREGLCNAVLIPLLLTVILFAGPIAVSLSNDRRKIRTKLHGWKSVLTDWIFWRNHVVAPFTEEFTFRACMLPILLRNWSVNASIVISPMLFGIAHFHHMIEKIQKGQDVKSALFMSSFQFAYTTIFGAYSAHLFVQTNHLAACVVVHAFCNFMGFPDFVELLNLPPTKRMTLSIVYVAGLVSFFMLLPLFTSSHLYAIN